MKISISQERTRDGSVRGDIDLQRMDNAAEKNDINELVAAVASLPDGILPANERGRFVKCILSREPSQIFIVTHYTDSNEYWTNTICIDSEHNMTSHCREYDD
ncbi:MAG: hypothetical protein FJZ95_10520 [Chloroflexi bacterium]|nr:hypothetical protein [Chloroflexota bacterium]